MKMVSFANYAWRSGLINFGVWIFTRYYMVTPCLTNFFFLSFPFFFFFVTWLLASLFSPSEEEEEEGETNKVEGEGSTLVSTG